MTDQTLGTLTGLPGASVADNMQIVASSIEESNPYVDAQMGVVASLIAQPAAVVETKRAQQIDTLRRSLSLLRIIEDPDLSDPSLVDAVASNFGKVRIEGSQSSGSVIVVVSRLEPVVVQAGLVFETGAGQFATTASVAARTSNASVSSETDRVLQRRDDGTYSFAVPVRAVATGASGDIAKDTQLTPVTPIANFVKAFAAADFTGGVSAETNAQLAARMSQGVSAKTLAGRQQMEAAIFSDPRFSGAVLASSIIGMGQPEMKRDQTALLPIGVGGRVDWYLQTRQDVLRVDATVSGTLLEIIGATTSVWQVSVGYSQQLAANAVWYKANAVRPIDATEVFGSFVINSQQRAVSMPAYDPTQITPDVSNVLDAAFSLFQQLTVTFTDTVTATAGLTAGVSQKNFLVSLVGQPGLPAIQQAYGATAVAHPAGEVLVKAPVPCFCSLNATISAASQSQLAAVSFDAVATAVSEEASRYAFTGFLPFVRLLQAAQAALPADCDLSEFSLIGELLLPDGSVRILTEQDGLYVPSEPGLRTTGRTAAFFLSPGNVFLRTAVYAAANRRV